MWPPVLCAAGHQAELGGSASDLQRVGCSPFTGPKAGAQQHRSWEEGRSGSQSAAGVGGVAENLPWFCKGRLCSESTPERLPSWLLGDTADGGATRHSGAG